MNAFVNGKSIWILEDDEGCRFVYEQILDFRYKTIYFTSLKDFQNALNDENTPRPAMIVADLILDDGNFLNFLTNYDGPKLAGIPFIVVSSIDDIDALRFCFNEGALDYITKPFKKSELLVKVENVLAGRSAGTAFLGNGKDIHLDGEKIDNLTSKQMQLLSLFVQSPTRSVNRVDILRKVWGDTTVHPKTVDVHLYNLRRKLNDHGYIIRSDGGGRWSLMSDRC